MQPVGTGGRDLVIVALKPLKTLGLGVDRLVRLCYDSHAVAAEWRSFTRKERLDARLGHRTFTSGSAPFGDSCNRIGSVLGWDSTTCCTLDGEERRFY